MIFTSKRLFLAASLLIIAICVSLGIRQSRVNAFQSGVVPGSLEALAQDAIEHNEQSVTIGSPKWLHATVSGIDDALAHYTVVVAYPVSRNSYVWNSELQMVGVGTSLLSQRLLYRNRIWLVQTVPHLPIHRRPCCLLTHLRF
jgi:hypothetical protein